MTAQAAPRTRLSAPLRLLPAGAAEWEAATDVVVVGAGAAGLSAARVAARAGRRVTVLVKGGLGSGATPLAQGGLAAACGPDDSPARHLADTVVAGAGLCDPGPVAELADGAPAELAELVRLGARFDRPHGGGAAPFALTREGGHTRDRVVHAGGDASGAEVDRVLRRALPADVEVLASTVLVDVLTDSTGRAAGVLAGVVGPDRSLRLGVLRGRAVVLATGGFGQAWASTTAPRGMTGDGLAAALRAGAAVQDVEFVQFHPTVLWSGPAARGRQPLLTEALRGEGAVIVDETGARVLAGVHPLADLAPRDVVADAMHRHLRSRPPGRPGRLFLDGTRLGRDTWERRFPSVLAACRARGIDPVTVPVPVAPGAHYTCGGVAADLAGRTSVPGLYAVGEVAASGTHGANRLASNSLTEALLAGRRCGDLLAADLPVPGEPVLPPTGPGAAASAREGWALAASRMLGVARHGRGLAEMADLLAGAPEADGLTRGVLSLDDVEAASLHTVTTLVALAAAVRTESRGCHRRDDFPEPDEAWRRRVLLTADGDAVAAEAGPGVAW